MKENKEDLDIFIIPKTILFILCIILLIISISIIYKSKKYPDKIPDIFGIKPFIVFSETMQPEINKGDLLFVKIVDVSSIEKNDIIAFRNEDDTVTTHRIIKLIEENGQTYYKTKGDATFREDTSLVSPDKLEGIYIGKISRVGEILYNFHKPTTLLLVLIIILAVGLIWIYIANKIDIKNEMKEEKIKENKDIKKEEKIKEKINN